MKKLFSVISILTAVGMLVTACSVPGIEEEVQDVEVYGSPVLYTLPEYGNGKWSLEGHFENETNLGFVSTGDEDVTISEDRKEFRSPDLNLTINMEERNVYYVTGNVDATTVRSFVIEGWNSVSSAELNGSYTIVDEMDDSPTVLEAVNVPSVVYDTADEINVTAVFTDADSMEEVHIELEGEGSYYDTRVFPYSDAFRIDVDESLPNFGEGNYTVTFTAIGVDPGEGDYSLLIKTYNVQVERDPQLKCEVDEGGFWDGTECQYF